MRYTERVRVGGLRNVAWGTVPPKPMNVAEFYLLWLDLSILTSILNANFLAQTISEIKREYWN